MSSIDYLLGPTYSPPLRGRLAPQGLGGTTVADVRNGGLPSRADASSPAGDAGEGLDVPNVLRPSSASGKGDTYRPHPYLPSTQHLDYVQKLTSTSLLTLGLALLLIVAVFRPGRALNLLARGAKKRAGID